MAWTGPHRRMDTTVIFHNGQPAAHPGFAQASAGKSRVEAYLGRLRYLESEYHVLVVEGQRVKSDLGFAVYECVRVHVHVQTPRKGSKYIAKRLTRHFAQGGVYYSRSILLCSVDFTEQGYSALLHWNKHLDGATHYCVAGFIGGPLVARRVCGY